MRKALCLAFAGAALLGVASTASARTPIKLTNAQLDGVVGGAVSSISIVGSCSAASGCSATGVTSSGNLVVVANGVGGLLLTNVALLAHVGLLGQIPIGTPLALVP